MTKWKIVWELIHIWNRKIMITFFFAWRPRVLGDIIIAFNFLKGCQVGNILCCSKQLNYKQREAGQGKLMISVQQVAERSNIRAVRQGGGRAALLKGSELPDIWTMEIEVGWPSGWNMEEREFLSRRELDQWPLRCLPTLRFLWLFSWISELFL